MTGRDGLALARVLVLAALLGCNDGGRSTSGLGPEPAAPESPPLLPVLILSDPAPAGPTVAGAASLGDPGVVYASLAPWSLPGADRIDLRTRSTGAWSTAVLVNGGFDPIPIDAIAGDTIDLTVRLAGNGAVREYIAVVPVASPPVVVRSYPTARKRDVPLNLSLLVVFSEPMADATLTSSAIALTLGGTPVPATMAFGDSAHVSVTITPAAPLAAGTQYGFQVDTTIQDLGGEALAHPVAVTFTTVPDTTVPGTAATGSILFASLVDGKIYSIGVDGTGRTTLASGGENLRPAWSPDGQRIAFVRYDDPNKIGHVYLMDADGSNVVQRTAGANLGSVAWSPDGRLLAVSTEMTYDSDIWVIPADDDGSAPVHLAASARSPAWSPDGQRIAYVHISGDDGYDALAVMNADGTGAIDLTSQWGGRYGTTWSPDGSRIASSLCLVGVCDLVVMDADGSNVSPLTSVGSASWGGAWSPDGLWIAVTLWEDEKPSVAYLPADGGIPRLISRDAYSPSWQP